MTLLDQTGRPIDRRVLDQPQTAAIARLRSQTMQPMLAGLTAGKIASALQLADQGSLLDQHRLFADLEDRDAHLRAEMDKRRLAVQTLDWDIVPPRNASAAEIASGEWVKEILGDAVDPVEDLILALMDGPGHGFAAVELEWRRWGGEWLPQFHPRPHEWFRIDRERRELRLNDASADGAVLLPFGWVLHTHGKARTGYLGRLGLLRTIVWPFLYKHYAVGDLAEFLETYGLPIIVGKYFSGASESEKTSLLEAVSDLGHDARAIMPQDMSLEIEKIAGSGDSAPHLAMIDWCERSMSKAVLGQVLSAEARSTGLGSGLANVHNEVRHDIRDADARQIAATLTRDLVYPLIALNRPGVDSLARCPRLVFDTGEAADIKTYAEALPALVALNLRIPVDWAHEKLKIPLASEQEAVLGAPRPETAGPSAGASPAGVPDPAAALGAQPATNGAVFVGAAAPAADDPTPVSALSDRLQEESGDAWRTVLAHVERLVREADSLDSLQSALLAAYDGLPLDDLRAVLETGFSVARLAGMADVRDESDRS